jgi:hypothetical protein
MLMVMVISTTYSEVETSTRKRNVSKYMKTIGYIKSCNAILVARVDERVMYHLQVLYIMILCVVIIHLLIN